jgi:negative regulator of flagellin synthesis FlgM
MVDPIGPKGLTPSDLRVVPVTPVAAAAKAAPSATPEVQVSPTAQLAGQLAAQPPVDADRIARIKRAIVDGTFPILPARIADQMLAIRYDWMANDPA